MSIEQKVKGKVKKVDGKDLDVNMTVNVTNQELLGYIDTYGRENTAEKLNDLINCMVNTRMLIPAVLDENRKPSPCLISNNEGKHFLAVYTDKEQIPDHVKSDGIMNMPYMAANRTVVGQKEKITGLVINPFTQNLILQMPLLERIEEVEAKKAAAGKQNTEPKELTGEQYVQFERRQFEVSFLPKKLFSGGQHFIDTLLEKKESYIDELYEESYKEKRMYPYIEEDFGVMPMDISGELMVIRVDMPERDIVPGLVLRVYLIWKPEERKAAYYRITRGIKGTKLLEEVTPEIRLVNLGDAPQSGSELQEIIDRAEGKKQ